MYTLLATFNVTPLIDFNFEDTDEKDERIESSSGIPSEVRSSECAVSEVPRAKSANKYSADRGDDITLAFLLSSLQNLAENLIISLDKPWASMSVEENLTCVTKKSRTNV